MWMCVGTLLLICIVEMYINFILGCSAGGSAPPPTTDELLELTGVPPPNDGCAVRIDCK